MLLKTETGSWYELEGLRIRRLTGSHLPTERQAADGAWQEAETIYPNPPIVGKRILVEWFHDADRNRSRCTYTSTVTEVYGEPILQERRLSYDGPFVELWYTGMVPNDGVKYQVVEEEWIETDPPTRIIKRIEVRS